MPASISVSRQFDTRYSWREVQIAKVKKCPSNQSALISIPLFFVDMSHLKAGLVGLIPLASQNRCDQHSRIAVIPRLVVQGLREHRTGITIQRKRRDRCLILWDICVVDLCQGFLWLQHCLRVLWIVFARFIGCTVLCSLS